MSSDHTSSAPRRTLRLRRESWGGFVIGSFLFGLAATRVYGHAVGPEIDNITYFVGSLFFTTAGFIQLRLSGRPVPGGEESATVERYDWWAALIQFVGTLLFNVSTGGVVLIQSLTVEQDRVWGGWSPDLFGRRRSSSPAVWRWWPPPKPTSCGIRMPATGAAPG